MIKIILIFSIALFLSLAVGSRSSTNKILAMKWTIDISAILLLGSLKSYDEGLVQLTAYSLVFTSTLLTFLWVLIFRNREGYESD